MKLAISLLLIELILISGCVESMLTPPPKEVGEKSVPIYERIVSSPDCDKEFYNCWSDAFDTYVTCTTEIYSVSGINCSGKNLKSDCYWGCSFGVNITWDRCITNRAECENG